jgi:hypothetical protein
VDSSVRNRLRLVRIVGDGILREKLLPREELSRESVALIALQLKGIIGAMESEWEVNPSSRELKEAFLLVESYLECLTVGNKKL